MRSERFLNACRLQPTDKTPIWIMRQAGRYLEEYREIRSQYKFLELCKTPEAAAEVTLLPINKFELDAAILFADIMLPLEGMGVDLDIIENVGPVIDNPIRSARDVDQLQTIEPAQDVPYVLETIKILRQKLEGVVPLIGFSGAPFTLASYMIEGRPSKNFLLTKQLMFNEPSAWAALMEKLTEVVISYLKAQIEAGAQAIQLFDSWVGSLGPDEYREYVLPYTKRIFESLNNFDVPKIHFGVVTSTLLKDIATTDADVIGADWRIGLNDAWNIIGHDKGIQGNLDPTILFSSEDVIREHASKVLDQANGRNGHIFNLGHGILPKTPPENVRFLVDLVHELSATS